MKFDIQSKSDLKIVYNLLQNKFKNFIQIKNQKGNLFLLSIHSKQMQISQLSSSARIYLDQITNYIQTGQGYQQLRIHLLKELNSIDPDNPNSDQTLAPALVEHLRKWLLTESSELKSRTIDVLEDIIKHADQIIDFYVTSQSFCITLSTSILYKFFNPFSKAIFDENRLRLCSVVMFYHQKFQKDPTRYFHIFHLYKQLKEKNCTFPPKTFIEIPKVNEFRKQKPKTPSQKSSESDRIGVTFDSIIQFVQDCQKQFSNNKASCANTQFVRALKVKAKTLFDLSQNSQGIELNAKQKEHAKQLYKQIRTMLKEIEKISEEKIKEQKIKSEKEFAQEKIQQISPNKNRESKLSSGEKGHQSEKIKQSNLIESTNLLEDITTPPVQNVKTPVKNVQVTPKKQNQTNLLDDVLGSKNENDEFKEYTSQIPSITKKPVSSSSLKSADGFKPIKKPPRPQQFTANTQQVQLIETTNSSKTPKKSVSQIQQTELIETTHQPTLFSKKSIHSTGKHSVHSAQSDRPVNLLDAQPNPLIFKQQGQDTLEFENAQHFSKFQIVNNYIEPNKYGEIPMDIDFSDSSSQQSAGSQRVTFNLGNDNNIFDNESRNQPYDKSFRTPKKQSSYHETENNLQKDIEKLSLSANVNKQQQKEELIANYNFGILADIREVKPYDYSQFQNLQLERSSISNLSEEEERKINLTPGSINKNNGLTSLNDLSPTKMNFNSQKKKSAKHQTLDQNDEGEDDEEFGNFQEVPTAFGMEGVTFGSQKALPNQESTLLENAKKMLSLEKKEQILSDKTPQKGQLIDQDEQGAYNGEPIV